MGNDVGGLRDSFYRDLRREYRDEGVDSFLYRYFWREAVTGLLEEYFPQLSVEYPIQPENSGQIRAWLKGAAAVYKDLLLRPVPKKKDRKERRDFWEELWLNDAGYQAELISDRDYYLWLVEYLAAHDLYYKDTSMWDGRRWLDKLLREGWLGAGEARSPGLWRQKSGKSVFSTAQISVDLRELAERIKTNREDIARRLHGLEEQGEDYLLWLTRRLEQMALHIRIKDWLQNSGYPLVKEGDMSARFSAKISRKQDFSMRLLEAYCANGWGGGFLRRDRDMEETISCWRLTDDGFCLPDAEEVETLRKVLEQSGESCFYIPLAVDLQSGCTLFLAGKDTYKQVYQNEEKRWEQRYRYMAEECRRAQETYEHANEARARTVDRQALREACERRERDCKQVERKYRRVRADAEEYKKSPARLCFDYLRLDRALLKQLGENPAGAFRLRPLFHKQAKEESYQKVLERFIAYCKGECDHSPSEAVPRETVQEFNWGLPADVPATFHWASEGRSQESEDAFHASHSRSLEYPGSPPPGYKPRYPHSSSHTFTPRRQSNPPPPL